jgi:hypothetical protein
MQRTPVFAPGLVLLLAACILLAGCTSPETTTPAAQPGTTTTTPAANGPLYSAGDVVKNPSASADSAWLVIGYDPAEDRYERALIYSNPGGGWGYRTDDRTEKSDRAIMEKVYSVNLGNIAPSSVPIVTPTIVTPTQAAWTPSVTAVTTTSEANLKPYVERSLPDHGYAGTSCKITQLVGSGFVKGATVSLSRAGYGEIAAKEVKVETPKSISCTIDIPASAPVGTWDLNVKNPNGQAGSYANYFTINKDMSVVTTTIATRTGTVPIDYIDPPFSFSGRYSEFTITGSGFKTNAKVALRSGTGKGDIVGKEVRVDSDTQLRVFFEIPAGSFGTWDVIVTNTDGTYGAWLGGFSIS